MRLVLERSIRSKLVARVYFEMLTQKLRLIQNKITYEIRKKTSRRKINPLIVIGEETYGVEHINLHSWDSQNKLIVGKYCSIADRCHIFLGGNHDISRISTYPFGENGTTQMIGEREGHPLSNGDVVIGNDVWLGSGVTIMSGVTIGNGAVVAANSHVVRDVKPYEIVGGNPAKHIRFRFSDVVIAQLLELEWWNWNRARILNIRDLLTSAPNSHVIAELKNLSD